MGAAVNIGNSGKGNIVIGNYTALATNDKTYYWLTAESVKPATSFNQKITHSTSQYTRAAKDGKMKMGMSVSNAYMLPDASGSYTTARTIFNVMYNAFLTIQKAAASQWYLFFTGDDGTNLYNIGADNSLTAKGYIKGYMTNLQVDFDDFVAKCSFEWVYVT